MTPFRLPLPTVVVGLALLFLVGCQSDDDPAVSQPRIQPVVGEDTSIVAFESAHVYFAAENRRSLDVAVEFPAADQLFQEIELEFALSCPSGNCDAWDRLGWISVVDDDGSESPIEFELSRFITPYGIGANWTVDLTDLRPVLTGTRTVRVFIDTWVGPGHPSGDGWLVDATFHFVGGRPLRDVIDVIPLFNPQAHVYGDPAVPYGLESDIEIPRDASSLALRSFVTGHGQGNAQNCAEFCRKRHWFGVGAERAELTLWRDDCTETAVPGQFGNWTSPRAGWCPGAEVHAWVENFDTGILGQGTLTAFYGAESYENTCRPDATDCAGCVFSTGCDYNGGSHTAPVFYVSSAMILYR